jgi:chromosome segregation ATPase
VKQSYTTDVASLEQRLAQNEKTNTDLMGDLSAVTKRLQITQAQLRKARKDAQVDSQQIRDDETKQFQAMDMQVNGQLATKASNDDVKQVSGQVTVVRTDLDSTKKDLQMARSEMGTLIAKNHDDIETLRRLGERDYIEFTVAAKNTPQKVGDVTIELKGLRGHVKSGQRGTGQNRPTDVARNMVLLSHFLLIRQARFGSPASRPAFQNVTVV